MRKHLPKFFLLFFILNFSFLILNCFSYALDVPQLRGYVNDYANMISPAARSQMEAAATGPTSKPTGSASKATGTAPGHTKTSLPNNPRP